MDLAWSCPAKIARVPEGETGKVLLDLNPSA